VQNGKSKEVKKNLEVPMSKEEEKFLKPTVLSNEKRKLNFKEKEELKTLEKKLAELEIIKLELTDKLSDTSKSNSELYEAGSILGKVISELDELSNRWLELSEFA
jgi:ATP-binding cassette subfamily F protein uup